MAFPLLLFFWAMACTTVGIFLSKVWWMPPLISVHGQAIDNELVLSLIAAGTVFFLAQIGLGLFIWKFRGRRGGRASNWHENSKLEATWTIATAVLFIGLAIQGNRVWAGYFEDETPPDALTIEVTAQQFTWNMRYPGPDGQFGRTDPKLINDSIGEFLGIDPNDPAGKDDIMTQNLMAVPVNRPIRVYLRTKDVTHSFFIPQMRIKQDTLPGMLMSVHFTATKTGEYEIACAELCGMQHYKMRARLLVMEQGDYDNWLRERAARQ